MNEKSALIITSIASPNEALKDYAEKCHKYDVQFIVIGDSKSPKDFQLEHCDFYSLEKQKSLSFSLAEITPEKHYSRKNLGYLLAIQNGAELIIETDDDNIALPSFWKKSIPEFESYHFVDKSWVNIYSYFTDKKIWPRAFPLELVNSESPSLKEARFEKVYCPVQQGLADDNPDVDAVFRLVKELPVKFKHAPNMAFGRNTWCPFNSQNTRWFKVAFPLLYLPSYCSFRMTDIWRSFIAQRICWENNWSILFHKPTVRQERNEHNLMKDFGDEVTGFLSNMLIGKKLQELNLKKGEKYLLENLITCYELLTGLKLIGEQEMTLVEAWCKDINSLLLQEH